MSRGSWANKKKSSCRTLIGVHEMHYITGERKSVCVCTCVRASTCTCTCPMVLTSVPYSGKFSNGANFRIFRMCAVHTKIRNRKIRTFE